MNRGTVLLLIPILLGACGEMPDTPYPAQQPVAQQKPVAQNSVQPPVAQQQQETPEQARKRYCKGVMGTAMMQGTSSGTFNEGIANANAAYYNCMAGLPPPVKQKPVYTKCRQDMSGEISCTSY